MILTVRLIKSFEYRTEKNLVLNDSGLEEMKVSELIQRIREEMGKRTGMRGFNTPEVIQKLDTLKLYTRPHGSKVF